MNSALQHRTLVYTIILFGLVAAIGYWQIYQLDQQAPAAGDTIYAPVQIDITTLFGD